MAQASPPTSKAKFLIVKKTATETVKQHDEFEMNAPKGLIDNGLKIKAKEMKKEI